VENRLIDPPWYRPGEVIPGVASYYASTFQEGIHTHGVLVKTREGRPIHIDGHSEHPVSRGRIHYRAMGDLLGLYDPDRLRAPSREGQSASWEDAIRAMARTLSDAHSTEKPVLLLTDAIVSPTLTALIGGLSEAVPSLRHAAWEPCLPWTEIAARKELFGNAILPVMRFDRAAVILSLQSDFLGSDANAPVYIRDFASRRTVSNPSDSMYRTDTRASLATPAWMKASSIDL